jgi:hypothetical protein
MVELEIEASKVQFVGYLVKCEITVSSFDISKSMLLVSQKSINPGFTFKIVAKCCFIWENLVVSSISKGIFV